MLKNSLQLSPELSKADVQLSVAQWLEKLELHTTNNDFARPWGGFFVIGQDSLAHFLELFFTEVPRASLTGQLSPKILVVAPHVRLSWQYHFRRSEIWKVVHGPIAVALSPTDDQPAAQTFQTNELITIGQGTRHRLIGIDNWGVAAEIWQHTDPSQPSDENDIVRVQDDFGR